MAKEISINQYLQNTPKEVLRNISGEICIKDVAKYWQQTPRIIRKDLIWRYSISIKEIQKFSLYFINPSILNTFSVKEFDKLSPIFQLMIVLSLDPEKKEFSFREFTKKI